MGGEGTLIVKRRKNMWMVGPSVSAMVRSIHPGKGRMVGPSVSAMVRIIHPGKGRKGEMCPGIVMVFCLVFAGWNVHLSIRVFFV